MGLSESKRRATQWDAANMTVLGCKVRRDRAEQFKAACKKNGTSPNAIFLAAMEKFMEEYGEAEEDTKP